MRSMDACEFARQLQKRDLAKGPMIALIALTGAAREARTLGV
jgi:hypothetical protein